VKEGQVGRLGASGRGGGVDVCVRLFLGERLVDQSRLLQTVTLSCSCIFLLHLFSLYFAGFGTFT
jgi:hypothetical protein